jgi:LD-carboxypeptidase N-terminal domain
VRFSTRVYRADPCLALPRPHQAPTPPPNRTLRSLDRTAILTSFGCAARHAAGCQLTGCFGGWRRGLGDRVRLVSPSSRPIDSWLAESMKVLRGWGLEPEVGSHALDEWGFMAGRDEHRLTDLNDAFSQEPERALA